MILCVVQEMRSSKRLIYNIINFEDSIITNILYMILMYDTRLRIALKDTAKQNRLNTSSLS